MRLSVLLEGKLRAIVIRNGQWEDEHLHSILIEVW